MFTYQMRHAGICKDYVLQRYAVRVTTVIVTVTWSASFGIPQLAIHTIKDERFVRQSFTRGVNLTTTDCSTYHAFIVHQCAII